MPIYKVEVVRTVDLMTTYHVHADSPNEAADLLNPVHSEVAHEEFLNTHSEEVIGVRLIRD